MMKVIYTFLFLFLTILIKAQCPAEPTIQASSILFSSTTQNSMTISWTNGNGTNRLVVIRPNNPVSADPVDGVSYTANTTYPSGSSLGGGVVVYNGVGNSVSISGLTAATHYHVAIYEFNSPCNNYLTSSSLIGNNPTISGVLINEIMINPSGANDGSGMPNTSEWFELFNATSTPVDISCWILSDGDFAITIPSGTIIAPGDFFTIADDIGLPIGGTTGTIDLDWTSCGCRSFGAATQMVILTNGNEQAVLFNSTGTIQDAVVWGGGQALPTTLTTAAGTPASCAATTVTLPTTAGGAYETIAAPANGFVNKRNYDGGGTWSTSATNTFNTTNGSDPLPIELTVFDGLQFGGSINLFWETATETNNNYFVLEKSMDAISFAEITRIQGVGNSHTKQNYSHIDYNPHAPISYYRLKQVDFDGQYSYSNILAIKSVENLNSHFNIYPNPANFCFEIKSDILIESIQINDLTGKCIKYISPNYFPNKTIPEKISIDEIQSGYYIILIKSNLGIATKSLLIE